MPFRVVHTEMTAQSWSEEIPCLWLGPVPKVEWQGTRWSEVTLLLQDGTGREGGLMTTVRHLISACGRLPMIEPRNSLPHNVGNETNQASAPVPGQLHPFFASFRKSSINWGSDRLAWKLMPIHSHGLTTGICVPPRSQRAALRSLLA